MISLDQMLKAPQLYQEVAHAARTRAAGTANAAEEADSIRKLSEWEGASGDAADDANRRTVSTFEHSTVSDKEFAARAESASQSAAKNAQDIQAMLNKADEYPAVHVDLHTNEVKPADMTNMNKGAIDRAWQKYVETKAEVERIVAAGNATDLEFARTFVAGTGGSEDTVSALAHENGTATRKVFEAPPAGRLDGTGYWQIDKTKPMASPDSPPPPPGNYTQEMPQSKYTEGVKSAPPLSLARIGPKVRRSPTRRCGSNSNSVYRERNSPGRPKCLRWTGSGTKPSGRTTRTTCSALRCSPEEMTWAA